MNPEKLIETFGTLGLFAIIFAESGLLIGFFLPGDSLLFSAGLLASKGTLNLPVIMIGSAIAAVVGDQVGYLIGRRAGPALFRRPDSRLFKQKNVERAHAYFEKNGPKTIILARFLPVIRTFTPVVAGVGQMEYRRFVTFNVIGGVLWACGVTLAGDLLGKSVPNIDHWLLPIIVLIGAVSFVPVILDLLRMRRGARADGVVVAEPADGTK
ncbi:MAG TPA: VTT domain-containing protein [Acidimicrobiales bacterium]|nr:VTT domain-containing protein [Acidimicrobiales bacterium]